MQLSTRVPVSSFSNLIDYNSKIISIGSCFAENIADKFHYFKFQNATNPFGILFNPVSIESLIYRIVNKKEFTQRDIFFHNDLWHCFEVHSQLSSQNKEEFLENLNTLLISTHHQLANATHIIITYGTSWVYRNKETNSIVANCHKVPQNQFTKEILSVTIIEQSIQNTIDLIQKINSKCNFIFTISPVRHIKDGFFENNVSKSHLLSAGYKTFISTQKIANYFPSYEIMMDELRDYRFYAEDLLHPSQLAINYIWERFLETNINETIYPIMEEIKTIQKGLAHRSFNPESESHQKFRQHLQQQINQLTFRYPQFQF